ncbi:aminotransferase class I/II-fold pyridoxal phosphate-dependent enzyme [Aestuariivivens sediminicola]|uniref:aminotransferase class I/II-fold pyridoxal phosphate-dependent enzyme n=1 Tax=Aestuariivivens sediminicola TaxID=2913560 RepID=UPI001F59BD0C|nr:aminotransferase class I/II-fold pyridoxal phosphate-dependent enzyme [Aestuariivivens sediminicola]
MKNKKVVNNLPKDPFSGYFLSDKSHRFGQKLLQTQISSFWSRLISKTVSKGQYNYLQSGELKSTSKIQLGKRNFLNVSSYDYLGLIGNREIEASTIKTIDKYGTSTGGVRLLSGSHVLHEELEHKLAVFKGTEATITYTSGYMANLAIASALIDPKDTVLIDEKIHMSIMDALSMAKSNFEKFSHNNMEDLELKLKELSTHKRIFVIVEGIYSMDGSILDLPNLILLKKKYEFFLVIDEAHSFGILGKTGRGVNEHFGIDAKEVDIWTSSLSKAIPSNGGFIGGSRELIIFLQHQSSPYVFSSALNLGSVAAIIKSLEIIDRHPEKIESLWKNTNYFLNSCRQIGLNTGISQSQITPIIVGARKQTLELSAFLFRHKILSPAAVFPAVPFNEGRLRICMNADMRVEELDYIIEKIECGLKNNVKANTIQEYS